MVAILVILILGFSAFSFASELPLPSDEVAIVEAAVQFRIESTDVSTRRPVLLLDQTENWMPQEEEKDLDRLTPEVPDDIIRQIEERRVPDGLRQANKLRYSLNNVVPPIPVVLHDASDFDFDADDYRKTKSFHRLVTNLRKEPFVIRVSRPYKTGTGEAAILLHGISTWSGCGGLSLLRLATSESGWKVVDSQLLIIW